MDDIQLKIDMSEVEEEIETIKTKTMPLAMEYMAIDFWSNIRKEAPRYTSQLAGSFEYAKINPLAYRIFSMVEYARAVHDGTKAIPNVPYEPIKKWAEHKGLPPYFVWRKIKTKGINANRYTERAWEQTIKNTQRFMDQAVKETIGGGANG